MYFHQVTSLVKLTNNETVPMGWFCSVFNTYYPSKFVSVFLVDTKNLKFI